MFFSSFSGFLVNPANNYEEINISRKIFYFVVLFICALIFVYGLTIILQLFIPQPSHKAGELSFLKLIIYGLFLAPMFEELVFRLSLFYSKINLSISLSLANTAIFTTILDVRLITFFGAFLFILSFCASIIFLNNHKTAHLFLEKLWKEHFKLIFYTSALLFSLFHTTNYEISSISAFFIAIVFSVPQLIGALFLGYVRIKMGFFWAVLMHILFNAVPFGLMVLFG